MCVAPQKQGYKKRTLELKFIRRQKDILQAIEQKENSSKRAKNI